MDQLKQQVGVPFTQVLRAEWSRIAARRAAHGLSAPLLSTAADHDDPDHRDGDHDAGSHGPGLVETLGLALSGGGVRSATFSLGLMQAMAKARALESFDYLSTVSGGGYAGAFFGSLFARSPGSPRESDAERRHRARVPYDVLRGPIHRPAATGPTDKPAGWQLWWLRNSGRYLAPTGAGDYLYAVAMALRNLLAIHFVLGIAALMLGVMAIVADESLVRAFGHAGTVVALLGFRGAGLSLLALVCLALMLVPLGLAYFATETPRPGFEASGSRFWWVTESFWNLAGAALAAGVVGACLLPPNASRIATGFVRIGVDIGMMDASPALLYARFAGSVLVGGMLIYVGIVAAVALGCLAVAALGVESGAALTNLGVTPMHSAPVAGKMLSTRVVLTRQLATALKFQLVLVVFAALVAASFQLVEGLSRLSAFTLTTGGIGAVLIVVVKKLAGFLGTEAARAKFKLVPFDTIALVLGTTLLIALLTVWFTVVWLLAASLLGLQTIHLERVTTPLVGVFIALLPLAWIAGSSFQFVNLSSIQTLYASRLVRAYLGASNPARATDHDMRWARISDTHPADDLSLDRYYAPGTLAPVHLINVTLNETVSPTDPLVQRDRHGRPMSVSPGHLCIDGDWTPRRPDAAPVPPRSTIGRMAVGVRRLLNPVQPSSAATLAMVGGRAPEPLSLGSWISISGAAFSTGIGRGTTLGKSLLLGLSNVRLGYWWNAGGLARTPRKDGLDRALQWLAAKFQTQSYLAAELLGRFGGRYARYWYLSDGGHFDNTGVYELLRRGVGLVVCSDNGADPTYTGMDVANLMRITRIDFGCEFHELSATSLREQQGMAAKLADLVIDPCSEAGRGGFDEPRCLRIFWVTRPASPGRRGRPNGTVLIVVKPRLVRGAPGDLAEYASSSAAFPQESTADQFFIEAQWESYRKLGSSVGEALMCAIGFDPDPATGVRTGAARWHLLRRQLCRAASR